MNKKLVFELCRSAELSPDASIIAAETLTLPSVALIVFIGNALRKAILLMQGPSFASEESTAIMWRSLFDDGSAPNLNNAIVASYMSPERAGPVISAKHWVALLDQFKLPTHLVSSSSAYVSFCPSEGTSRNYPLPIYAEIHNSLKGAPLFVSEDSIFKLMLSLCLVNKNLDQVLNEAAGNWFIEATLEHVRTAVRRFAEAWPPRGASKRPHHIDELTRRKMWLHEITVLLNVVDFQPKSV